MPFDLNSRTFMCIPCQRGLLWLANYTRLRTRTTAWPWVLPSGLAESNNLSCTSSGSSNQPTRPRDSLCHGDQPVWDFRSSHSRMRPYVHIWPTHGSTEKNTVKHVGTRGVCKNMSTRKSTQYANTRVEAKCWPNKPPRLKKKNQTITELELPGFTKKFGSLVLLVVFIERYFGLVPSVLEKKQTSRLSNCWATTANDPLEKNKYI